MDTRIQRVCAAHPAGEDVVPTPLITVVDGVWALCEGNGPPPHEWVMIPPTRPGFVADAVPPEVRQRWWRRWWRRLRSSEGSTDTSQGYDRP